MYDAIAREKQILIHIFVYIFTSNMSELQKKAYLYCDLNDIHNSSRFDEYIKILDKNEGEGLYKQVVAYNTEDFLVKWLRDLSKKLLDDESFFQIGDIQSTFALKVDRPHLKAIEHMIEHVIPNCIYVVDKASHIAYIHIYGEESMSEVENTLQNNKSILVVID